jgi:hypothetical protein
MGIKVEYDFDIEEEDLPVRGNAVHSGDPEVDRKIEDEILERLDRGDYEAWCIGVVTATVTVDGVRFASQATLGACSYNSEEEVRKACFEDHDLKTEAKEALKQTLRNTVANGLLAERILQGIE